jgi:MFS family permease
MKCQAVARALSENSPLPLPVEDHVSACSGCRELIRSLDSTSPMDPSPATLRHIAEGMAANLRPVRPLAQTRYFIAAFVGIFVCIAAVAAYLLGAFAFEVMTTWQTSAILGALAIGAGLLASSLAHQMIPGSRHWISPTLLPAGITLSLVVATVTLFQFQQDPDFWENAWICIRAGIPISVLAAVPIWVVLHRGAILSMGMTWAASGLLAGLVGTSVLEIHCPNLDARHILVSHLGVAVLCALAGLITGLTVQAVRRHSISSQ